MKNLNSFSTVSIVLAIAALIAGLQAAKYWFHASKVNIIPAWPKNADVLTEPGETLESQAGWIAGMITAVALSSDLNKSAARWTATAVVLSAFSSLFGVLVGIF